jgi:hypothetical protein
MTSTEAKMQDNTTPTTTIPPPVNHPDVSNCGHPNCAKGVKITLSEEFPITEADGAYLPRIFWVEDVYTDNEVHYHRTLNKWIVGGRFNEGDDVVAFDKKLDAVHCFQNHALLRCGLCESKIINFSFGEYREAGNHVVRGCAQCLFRILRNNSRLECLSCEETWYSRSFPLRVIDKYGKIYYLHEGCVQYNCHGICLHFDEKWMTEDETLLVESIPRLLNMIQDMQRRPCVECFRDQGAVVACRNSCNSFSHILCLPSLSSKHSKRVTQDSEGNIHYYCKNCKEVYLRYEGE